MNLFNSKNKVITNELANYVILVYWSLFWLLNGLDKFIGGSQYLWVGRDRFAQFQKFFASAGIEAPIVPNLALILTAALEIFAFVFFTGALLKYLKKNRESARSWFFAGIVLTLITFTFFATGDHIFGDRFELLEHTLFWFITIFSWVVFVRIDAVGSLQKAFLEKRQMILATVIVGILVIVTSTSIFRHNKNSFSERTEAVKAQQISGNIFKFSFPFLGGSKVFENSLEQFKKEHPAKTIDNIYTVPEPLKLKKADGLIFYVITKAKE